MTTSDRRPGAPASKAVILARGLGTRMRAADRQVALDPAQAAAADRGVKAMMPVGRPFLDYVLNSLADAGIGDACLVIGPEHDAVRRYYEREVALQRIRVGFAVQAEALGTADAVLAAERFTEDDPFLVLNADNLYPVQALAALRRLPAPATVGFTPGGLVRDGALPPSRIAKYALLDVAPDGRLRRVIEKPGDDADMLGADSTLVSMNCWLFDSAIFVACRAVPRSPRGELELPLAVQYAIDRLGMKVSVAITDSTVLDLSHRGDIPVVAERLRGVEVRL